MIAIGMLYTILVTALAAGSALALERAAHVLRRPARFVWLAALVLATSFVAERMATSTRPAPPEAAVAASGTGASVARGATVAASTPTRAPWWQVTIHVPTTESLDRPLLGAWLAGSLLWGAILIGSATRLRRRRDGWRPDLLDGTPVYLSHDVGPALFGLTRYSIVIPSWVRDLEPEQRRLILAHEREHARASDPMTLLAGALLLLVQPWNPAAWLIFRRLRFAVEADCDARVTRGSRDVRTYGELLLDLGERTLAGVAPVAAISEPSTNLERRITLLTALPRSRPVARSLALVVAGGLFVFVACQVPRPVRGAHAAAAVANERDPAGAAAADRLGRQAASDRGHAIFHVTSTGTSLSRPYREFPILLYADGPARVGLGRAAPTELRDTLRLKALAPMRIDVTDADVHLRLTVQGRMRIEGSVEGGPSRYLCATGTEIVLLRGGAGIRSNGRTAWPDWHSPAHDCL